MKQLKPNDCKKCPYYQTYWSYDDAEEYCRALGKNGWSFEFECRYPMSIRKILSIVTKIRELYRDLKIVRYEAKEERERIKLGMTEEEYSNYKWGEW